MLTNLTLSEWTAIKEGKSINKSSMKSYDMIAERVKNGEEVIIQDEDRKVAFLSWQNDKLWEMPIVKFQKKDT